MQGDQDRATALKNYLASIETIQTDWIHTRRTAQSYCSQKLSFTVRERTLIGVQLQKLIKKC